MTEYRTIRGADCEHPEGIVCPGCLTLPVFDLETYSVRPLPAPRPPIAPGVLLEDDEARVYVSGAVLRVVARWAGALAMVASGAAVMYAEGQRQPAPGVGFAIGLALIMGAALLVTKGQENG